MRDPDTATVTGPGSDSPPSWWRCIALALLPAAVVLGAAAIVFGVGPRQFMPVWSDEIVYWNEAAVFARAGFDGGYITIEEEPARWNLSRFGPHGPVFAVFEGAIARAGGWRPYSPFLINLATITLAALAWARGTAGAMRPAAVLVVATFWPLLLYLPTNMQEPTHFAFAFLFALAVDRLHPTAQVGDKSAAGLDTSETRTWTYVWTAVLLIVAALLRPSWILMLLPLGWRRARRHGLAGIAVLLVLTAVAAAAAWTAFDVIASPSPQNTRVVTRAWEDSPAAAVAALGSIATQNLTQYVALREESPQIVLRYFLALFVVLLCARWWAVRSRAPRQSETVEIALVTIVPVAALVVLAGQVESWRDFRVLAPHLLVALLVVATRGGWERWIWAGTLALLPVYYNGFVAFHGERFATGAEAVSAMRDATGSTMPFVEGADPWANTLLVHADLLQFPLLGVPAGIGVSYVFDWRNLTGPVRSRYLLLRAEEAVELTDKVRLTPLGSTSLGTLYRNEGPVE